MRAISIWLIFIEFSIYYNGLHVTDVIDKVVIYILFMIFGRQMGSVTVTFLPTRELNLGHANF